MIKLAIFILLIFMSWYDIRNYAVRNIDLLVLFFLEVIYMLIHYNLLEILISFALAFLVFYIFYIFYIFYSDKFGGGDIKVITLLSLIFKFNIVYILFLSSLFGIIYVLLFTKNKIPYIPFLASSIIVFNIIKCYNLS